MDPKQWTGDGYAFEGEKYCCQGCAEGTGCICKEARTRDEVLAREKPRNGFQRSGAPMPAGELSGERDALGTEEPQDRGGAA